MSKIAIISQPDQGVLIDVSGCTTFKEAFDHLSSTLQVSDQFWKGMKVSINLGALKLDQEEILEILKLAKTVGISPSGIYATDDGTREALKKSSIPLGTGKPMTLPKVSLDSANIGSAEVDEKEKEKVSPLATITMRVVDAVSRKSQKHNATAESGSELENMETEQFEETAIKSDKDQASEFPHVKVKRRVSLDGRMKGDDAKAEKVEASVVTVQAEEKPEAVEEETSVVGETQVDAESKVETTEAPETAEKVETQDTTDGDTVEIEAEQKNKLEESAEPAKSEDKPRVEAESKPAKRVSAKEAEIEVETQTDEDSEELEADSLDIDITALNGPTTLYLRQNLRSGQTVSHKGHLVIVGDINPGAEVMADGDITVWGCLRGVAHAGIGGNVNAEIRALKLQPIQIRIAHAIARAPDRPRVNYAANNGPETARMVDGKIKVVRSRLE